MSNNPADYVISDDDTIEDANLDRLGLSYQGQPLTEARALELDEQIARDADAQARRTGNLVPGGKSLSGGGKHSPVVQTRVPETTHAALQQIADARGVTVSRVLRIAIDEFVTAEAGR